MNTRDTYQVVFIGGPADGTVWNTSQLPDTLRQAIPESVTAASYTNDTPDTTTERGYTVATYQLAITYGAPSRDDQGRYRYQYRGTR